MMLTKGLVEFKLSLKSQCACESMALSKYKATQDFCIIDMVSITLIFQIPCRFSLIYINVLTWPAQPWNARFATNIVFEWYTALGVQQGSQPRTYTTPKIFLKLNQQFKFKSEKSLQADLPCSSVSLDRSKKWMNQKYLHYEIQLFLRAALNSCTANITKWFLIVFILQSWDPDLAKTAKGWARKCLFKHNIYLKQRGKVHPKFGTAGENIWTGSASAFTVKGALSSWFNEVEHYDYNTNKCTRVCGHYTQVGFAFLHLNHEPAWLFWYKTFLLKMQWTFPGSVVLLYVCVHMMFLCSHLWEEKSHCVTTLNVALWGFFWKKTVQPSSSQIS